MPRRWRCPTPFRENCQRPMSNLEGFFLRHDDQLLMRTKLECARFAMHVRSDKRLVVVSWTSVRCDIGFTYCSYGAALGEGVAAAQLTIFYSGGVGGVSVLCQSTLCCDDPMQFLSPADSDAMDRAGVDSCSWYHCAMGFRGFDSMSAQCAAPCAGACGPTSQTPISSL